MKKNLLLFALAGLLTAGFVSPVFAGDKEVTITGTGKCAKCALHETEKCQNAIQTEEHGKAVTYYLADNKVSQDFHENLCKESKKVSATGSVKEEGGKKVLTASKIELAK